MLSPRNEHAVLDATQDPIRLERDEKRKSTKSVARRFSWPRVRSGACYDVAFLVSGYADAIRGRRQRARVFILDVVDLISHQLAMPEDTSLIEQLERWLEAQVPTNLQDLPYRMLETMERVSNELCRYHPHSVNMALTVSRNPQYQRSSIPFDPISTIHGEDTASAIPTTHEESAHDGLP